MFYARIVDGRVAEVIEPLLMPDGVTFWPIEQRFHPDFLAALVPYDPDNPPPEPEPAPTPAPAVVTMRQARLALLAVGKLDAANQALAELPGDQGKVARIEWEFAATVVRQSDLVAMMANALALDDPALDSLFTAASHL